MDFFLVKICLLNHRKFEIMQEGSSWFGKCRKGGTPLKQNVFFKTWEKFNK